MLPASRDRYRPFRCIARAIPGGMALGRWARRTFDPDLRAIAALERTQAGALFQPSPITWEDRYPSLFAALAERLADIPEPRILSFGCSNGAEVRSLRHHLPQARITGIDINPRAIGRARKADPHPLSRYAVGHRVDPPEQFDAILAMAVFRDGLIENRRPDDCSAILPFRRFAEAVEMLDRCLAPGGWLALYNAHFRFADTPLAACYRVDGFRMADHAPLDLLYGADDRRIDGARYDEVLFAKPG